MIAIPVAVVVLVIVAMRPPLMGEVIVAGVKPAAHAEVILAFGMKPDGSVPILDYLGSLESDLAFDFRSQPRPGRYDSKSLQRTKNQVRPRRVGHAEEDGKPQDPAQCHARIRSRGA
jgi:hypothetical protein